MRASVLSEIEISIPLDDNCMYTLFTMIKITIPPADTSDNIKLTTPYTIVAACVM